MPSKCVHALEEHDVVETVGREFHIIKQNGSRMVFEECSSSGIGVGVDGVGAPSGWVAYAQYNAASGVTMFNGQWQVPQKPSNTNDQQTLFLFTGLQNAVFEEQSPTIIQPVLQWGPSDAGGGQYWSIASWFVGNGNAAFSQLKIVYPGDIIYGSMSINSNGRWVILTQDKTIGQSTSLTTTTSINEPYAFVTLEVYNVNGCTDYPQSASVPFNGLQLSVTPSWMPQNPYQFCNENIAVNSPSSIVITF
jgi:hypothetical protein